MSTTLQLAAPATSTCTRYCGKHPQERVVGVCSACLANKLSSLIYSSAAFAPDNFRVCSPLSNSPPGSINSPLNYHHPHRDHLQTISEEADSPAQQINNEGALGSTLPAPFTQVEVCAEAELAANSSVHSNIIEEQISLTDDVVPAIEEENPIVNQDIFLISDVVSAISNEEVRIINLEEGKPKANPYLRANKPIKCKRSKSLCGLKGESLIKLEKEAHEYESAAKTQGEQSNTGAKKLTLRALFKLDDEEKWRNRVLTAADTSESELGMHGLSAEFMPIEEEFDGGSINYAKKIEEAEDVHDNHTHNSHRCVPSASTLSSSVCPSMPSKLKHSVLLNSLLCRKTGDEKKGSGSLRKPSQVNEASRATFIRSMHEGGLTQASDEGGFIRATYIASESREALRRCRSKLERSVARRSVSSSQPASPPCVSHVVDMKSERKFNLTARVLAAELPSILRSSAELADSMVMVPPKTENACGSTTQIEELKEGQDSRLGAHSDSVAVAAYFPARLQSPKEGESRKAQDDEQVERAERAADATVTIPFITRANVDEAHEDSSLADAGQEEEAECKIGIPTFITATEASLEVPMAVGYQPLSCSSTSGKTIAVAGQQGTHKVPEECKNGGVWEAYSNKSGKGVRKWPSSSRTGKIVPAQSGLLRFYLTPLRASGRTRFSSTRRPPKRHFWSLIFI